MNGDTLNCSKSLNLRLNGVVLLADSCSNCLRDRWLGGGASDKLIDLSTVQNRFNDEVKLNWVFVLGELREGCGVEGHLPYFIAITRDTGSASLAGLDGEDHQECTNIVRIAGFFCSAFDSFNA